MKIKFFKVVVAVLTMVTAVMCVEFLEPDTARAVDAGPPPCDDIEGAGREVLVNGIPNAGVLNFNPAFEPLLQHAACVRDNSSTTGRYNLEGWVWNTNLGWISLYCPAGAGATNQGVSCAGSFTGGYGVYVDATNGELRGHAWGDNTGWISFNCKDDDGGCTAANTHKVIVEFDVDCQGEIYGEPNIFPGMCPDHSVDNSYAWSDSVGWIDLHGVKLPIIIPQVIDVWINIIPSPSFSGKDDPLLPSSNGSDEYQVTVEMTEIATGLPVPQVGHEFYIKPNWVDTVRYDQITADLAGNYSTNNNGPVQKPLLTGDFTWDSAAGLFSAPVTSWAPTSDMNYYDVAFLNEKFMLPSSHAGMIINPNELFLTNAEIAIYDSVEQRCVYPYSNVTGIDAATCFANFTLDAPPGFVAPYGQELYFAPAVDLVKFDNMTADTVGAIVGRLLTADKIAAKIKCTLSDCAAAEVVLTQGIEKGNFKFDPPDVTYYGDNGEEFEHEYIPDCALYDDEQPQCPAMGEDAYMYSTVRYSSGTGAVTRYFSAKLPRVFGTVVVNPVASLIGNVYSTGVTNPQTGQTVRSLGDVSTNILRDMIVKNVAAIVSGATVNEDEGEASISGDGTTFQFGDIDMGVGLLPDSSGDPQVFYVKNKNLFISGGTGWKGNRTIIVEGGSVFIKSDLYVSSGSPPPRLGIIVLKDYSNRTGLAAQGHVYIDPKVADIQANIYADGSMFSYDGDKSNILLNGEPLFADESSRASSLINQLYITGSVASQNTIGGAVRTPPILGNGVAVVPVEGAYGNNPSGRSQARLYDMNFLRYYGFVFERDPVTGHAKDQQLKLINPATAGDPSTPGYNIVAKPAPGKGYSGDDPDGDLVIVEAGNRSGQAGEKEYSAVHINFSPPPADLPGFSVTTGADVTIRKH